MHFRCSLILALLLLGDVVEAAVWFVSPRGTSEAAGDSWATALAHPAQAAARATAGDSIWVERGFYQGGDIRLAPDVRLLGGFLGSEGAEAERSGDPSATVLCTTNTLPVIQVLPGPAGSSTEIDGLTLEADAATTAAGRGVFADGASVVLRRCILRGFKSSSSPSVLGSAVGIVRGSLLAEQNEFRGNQARGHTAGGRDGYGMAIGGKQVDPVLIRSNRFVANRGFGIGVVSLEECRGEIANNLFLGNEVSTNATAGAGVLEVVRPKGVDVLRNRFLFNRGGSASALLVVSRWHTNWATNRVAFNLFAGNFATGTLLPDGQGTVAASGGAPLLIFNNTFVGNPERGITRRGPVVSANTFTPLVNNLFVSQAGVESYTNWPNARRNVFIDTGEDARQQLFPVGRPEGLADEEFIGGLRAFSFQLTPDAISRGLADPSLVPPGWLDLAGRPARHPDGTVDVGALAYQPSGAVVPPRILHVRPDGDDAASGASWTNALRTLGAAVARVDLGQPTELWLAAGRYDGSLGANRLPPNLTLRGSFTGSETGPEQRPRPLVPTTVLRRIASDPVLNLTGNGPWNELEGLAFEEGDRVVSPAQPAALEALSAWPHLHHCRFEGLASADGGAVLRIDGGLLEDCVFLNNTGSILVGNVGWPANAPLSVFRRNRLIGNRVEGRNAATAVFRLPALVSHNLWLSNRVRAGFGVVHFTESGGLGTQPYGFFHNTLVGNVDEAVNLAAPAVLRGAGSTHVRLRANLIAFNQGEVQVDPAAAASARDNLVFGNRGSVPLNPLPADHNRFVDPGLAADGWHLGPDSPARDAVLNPLQEGFEQDLDGEGAWLGTRPDIGADESVPNHPLAAVIARANLTLTQGVGAASGTLGTVESPCPDCTTREFRATPAGFEFQVASHPDCQPVGCGGEPVQRVFPFDFGPAFPGRHPLQTFADGQLLRKWEVWVRPGPVGALRLRSRGDELMAEAVRHPAVPLQFLGSTNLVDWSVLNVPDLNAFIATRRTEDWYFRILPR